MGYANSVTQLLRLGVGVKKKECEQGLLLGQLCERVGLKNSWKVETGIALRPIVVLKCLVNSMESYSLEYKGDDIRKYEEKRQE